MQSEASKRFLTTPNAEKNLKTCWRELSPRSKSLEDLEHDYLEAPRFRIIKAPRKLIWCGRTQDSSWVPQSLLPQSQQVIQEPHPMRTDTWQMKIHWKGRQRRQRERHFSKTMKLEFHPNGYVRAREVLRDGEAQPIFGIGEWEILPWGAVFTIYTSNHCKYIFHANLHLNPFGKQPKLLQGVVARETTSAYQDDEMDRSFLGRRRIPWFRPVVATFEAFGTGEDMADFSYQNRGIGLTEYVEPE
jgi:hypothetical protein